MQKTVPIPLKTNAYDIVIGNSMFRDRQCTALTRFVDNRSCHIISDTNVYALYGESATDILTSAGAARVTHCVFEPGERSKTLETVRGLYEDAIRAGLDRRSVIVALGGGVVGDTAAFTAATYMRGVDYVQLPTSLVAQVDSSIGGKTGVDLPEGKNLIGAFYQPKIVIIDTTTLTTLPPRQLRCGLAEVVKYGIILNADFFDFLESNVLGLLKLVPEIYQEVIERCCSAKAEVVLDDEFDHGRRAILNYGHTFGHALETLSGYSGLTHGEAIAIGMWNASAVANRTCPTSELKDLAGRQERLFQAIGLPTTFSFCDPESVLRAMKTDKKTLDGRIRLILPTQIGHVDIVDDVSESIILEAIGEQCDR